jgi:post-segregation antitoxin (ccd killing protein)
MADRAAKRMRRLSTENEEERTEQWMDGNIRYVADCNTHSSRQG